MSCACPINAFEIITCIAALHLNGEREEEEELCLVNSLATASPCPQWLVNLDTMRRGTHSSGGAVPLVDAAPLGEQIYVLEGKKRISGGSHQRRRYRWQAAEMSGNWVNDLIGGHKFSNRRIWFY